MKLAVLPLTITGAILCGGTALFCGVFNLIFPDYAKEMLEVAASIYPGYDADSTFADVLNVTLWATVDGALGGFLIAWLYNCLLTKCGSGKKNKN